MKFYSLFLFLLLAITACSSETETTTEENAQTAQTETAETGSDVKEPVSDVETGEGDSDSPDPDSLVVPSFTINFDFSEEVQRTLIAGTESLLIDLVLSGEPDDISEIMDKDYYNDEDYQVYLKNIEITYQQNEGQTLTIENLKISKEALSTLVDPNYTIGLNFYSSRTSSENNVFSGGALIKEVNTMAGKTHIVKVKML